MLTNQKIQQILIHVWNPKIDLNRPDNTEKLNQLISQIYALLESRDGSEVALSDFLKTQSIQNFNAEITTVKSEETAKLIMSWYVPIPMEWTDFGRVKMQRSYSRLFEHDYFVYQNDSVTEYIEIYYIGSHEIVIDVEKIQFSEIEKAQLIEAMRDLIKPSILTFFDSSIHPKLMRPTWYE